MSKQFMAILAVVVVGLGIVFWVSGSDKSDSSNGSTNSEVKPSSHITGKGKKNVTLQEYGDFQCSVCGIYYPVVKQVVAKYNEDIFFQFSNLPIPQVHPNALASARAAEAAGLQNKYFEMNDLLFQNQTAWSESPKPLPIFQSYAQQLNLDMTKFNTDFSSSAVNDVIQADIAAFRKTGKEVGTPTFFIDGVYVPNSELSDNNGPNLEKFSKVIESAINAKN
jgi:protein-disulfide isomerase